MCETRLKLNCLNSLAAPDTGNTPALSEACAAAYADLTCDEALDEEPPPACLAASGARADGATCGFPGQCQSDFCAIPPGSACGVCAALPKAGDSCAQLTTCGEKLTCLASTLLCSGFAAQGGACNKGEPCGAGLFCVGSTTTSDGTCQPSVETAGATCDATAKTGPGCDRNALLTCDGATDQCVTLPIATGGEACGSVSKVTVVCAAGGTCTSSADAGAIANGDAGPTAATAETCVGAAPDLAPCDLVHGPFCLTPARCVTAGASSTAGTCQFQSPASCN